MRSVTLFVVLALVVAAPSAFALVSSQTLGDTVWYDTNANGVQDAGEPGIPGVIVTATRYDASGNAIVANRTTNADGYYLFALAVGTYEVTTNVTNLDPTFDYDGIGTPNLTVEVLSVNEKQLNIDFGYVAGSIGDYVWLDANRDGVQDAEESGIAGVTVNLLDAGGAILATTTTDAAGLYTFGGLKAGDYSVAVDFTTIPADLEPSYDLDGIGTANIAAAPLALGENRIDVDFGYMPPLLGSIGDYVWLDANRDGVQDAEESGIAGVTVNLLDAGGAILATTTTDAAGLYTFGGLKAGDYSVAVDFTTIPADLEPSYDLDGIGTANIAAAPLAAGENRTDVDFGYMPPLLGSIGDYVWFDVDGDTVQDAGEPGLADVTVELYDGTTLLATTTTDDAGLYLFSGLRAGTYTVKVVATTLPADMIQTYDLDGIGTANEATASLAAGENRTDVDFGYTKEIDDDRPYQTQTQGGWGNKPSGNNPGAMLHANFGSVYPDGLVIGSNHTLTFTNAQAITDFLPQGGTPGTLWQKSYINPTKKTEAGVFAGQVLALRLNVDFSDAGVTRLGLGSLKITRGTFAGWSVYELLDLCEQVLGGDSLGVTYSVSALSDAATAVNENYVDGTTDKGYLAP